MKYILLVAIPYVFVLGLAAFSDVEVPPIDSEQVGFRGTGMVEVSNPRIEAKLAEANQPPDELGSVEPGGDLAKDIYENVQVLGDLTDDEFNHFMLGVTTWVAPEEGCGYCHNEENFASDEKYTKIVSRRMMQMTQTINKEYTDHVGAVGVNCYTCHRGNHVPEYVWTNEDYHPQADKGFAASRNGQNLAVDVNGHTSLPYNAMTQLLTSPDPQIRVAADRALPTRAGGQTIQLTESTYSLMINMSEGLGVSCNFCHNSRAFSDWSQSSDKRVKAFHGINMVQHLNAEYLDPLASALPENRLGPNGDAPKAMCKTCHQGINRPMYGWEALTDHPKALVAQ
jgi:photosynthetic reaction center cytochrome c subunit